jgi:hypothetical protein
MLEKSPLASEVINLRIMKDKTKSMQMHLDAITEDCVGTGLQSSEEETRETSVWTRLQGCDMGSNC